MAVDVEEVHSLALSLARGAGELARREAASGLDLGVESKGSADLVTRVDRDVERRIVHGIAARFPEHAVLGEESGRHGPEDAEVCWLVDPLDGTNNYAMGLDVYGVCLTALVDDEPVVAVVHDSVSGRSCSAIAGRGAESEGTPLRVADPAPLELSTVSWIQGYGVDVDDPFRVRAFGALERSCKRVLRTWAPSTDWRLLAAGGTQAVVAYHNEAWDLVGGVLLATEAGAAVHRGDGLVVVGTPATVGALRTVLEV